MACGTGACSHPLDLSRFSEPAAARRTDQVRPFRWLSALFAMNERWRQRQELMELDDRMLADIGISREEARREAGNPFWR